MLNIKRIFSIFLTVLITLSFCCCGLPNDSINILDEVVSPDGKYTAVIYTIDMGATTRCSYNLSVFKGTKSQPTKSGNVVISYSKFDISWSNSTTLNVVFLENDEIFKKSEKIFNIKIQYS